jgi:hypothetical protein
LKQDIESRCRLSKQYEETIDHLISGCPTLAKNEYIIRHDKVCTHHWLKSRSTREERKPVTRNDDDDDNNNNNNIDFTDYAL